MGVVQGTVLARFSSSVFGHVYTAGLKLRMMMMIRRRQKSPKTLQATANQIQAVHRQARTTKKFYYRSEKTDEDAHYHRTKGSRLVVRLTKLPRKAMLAFTSEYVFFGAFNV